MPKTPLILNGIAALGALYVAKMLVVDVAWADYRIHGGGWGAIVICFLLGAAFVALPAGLGTSLALRGHSGYSIGVGIASLVLDALVFAVVAAAFTP